MPLDTKALDRVFNPKTVVVIGDKKASGYMWLKSNQEFKGDLYSVQIDENEIPNIEEMGIKNFTSLADVPRPVDFAIVAVPRVVAGRIVADCIQNQVGGASLFTSGFAETATPEGLQAHETVLNLTKESGMVLIGPNCMGLYHPKLGLRFSTDQPIYEGGSIGFASQSGSHAGSVSQAAYANGLRLSKVVSFGNGIMLENADYLEYFAQDAETKIIAMYVEGLKDGRRYFDTLKKTTPHKPVVIWKGGQTSEGQRATSSHTASLAESMTIWEAAARQTGAILVHSIQEVIDTLKALQFLPKVTGYGCGLTGGAGGQSVSITDAFAKAGMSVPALSPHSYERLESFFSLVGAFFRNPIDMGSNRTEIDTILEILEQDPVIDVIVMQMGVSSWQRTRSMGEAQLEALLRFKEKSGKPVVAIPHSTTPYRDSETLKEVEEKLLEAGVPTFPTYEQAARAIKNAVDYHRFHSGA